MKLIKWENATVGIINTDNSVEFVAQDLNSVVKIYTQGKLIWTPSEYKQFIQDRIVSRDSTRKARICCQMVVQVYRTAEKNKKLKQY